jgi:isocitrate dehydrogenase kinase/phosphatase
MPGPPEWAETLSPDDWISKGETDVFPGHDFRLFCAPERYRDVFASHHADLFTPAFWNQIKKQLEQGWVPDFYPYPLGRRLRPLRR